ncbi:hypothetical protein GEMRC1_012463 [Eukaryota sp. GEM-RC1]
MLLVYTLFISLLLGSASCDFFILTDYIGQRPDIIKHRSFVHPLSTSSISTYSFYTRVNNSLVFSLLTVPATATLNNLIVYLPGGPCISLFSALFSETGPFNLVNQRPHMISSLGSEYPILFIDQPADTGLSISTSNDGSLTRSTEAIVDVLYQFITCFPEFSSSKIILGGSSFGIKFTSRLALELSQKFNIYGLFSGNPIISCDVQVSSFLNFLQSYGIFK